MTVASTGRDAVAFSIFLGDKVYPFSLRRTNLKNCIVKRESGCSFHSNGFDKTMSSHDHWPWLNPPTSSLTLPYHGSIS